MANLGLGRVSSAPPSTSTTRLSQRKFRYDAAAPNRKATAARDPFQAPANRHPAAAIPSVARAIRRRPATNSAWSRSIVTRVSRNLPHQLHESCGDAQNQERDVEEMRVKGAVEQVAHTVADHGADRQDESQGGVLPDHDLPVLSHSVH